MPTYEYECPACGHRFEKFQRMTEAPLNTCPQCGSAIRRLIGKGSGILFKGPGFYATDYSRSSPPRPGCGRDRPCCGRDTPCGTKPCATSE